MTFTVILPHRRNPGNDAALAIAIDCLQKNTVNDFTLLLDCAVDQPLNPRVNRMFETAQTEVCVYTASDMFFAPGWDVPMLAMYTPDTIVTNVVVEPRAIAMHPMNLEADYGKRADTFRRAQFEAFCKDAPVMSGQGWYAPYMVNRQAWLDFGGLMQVNTETDGMGFNSADVILFDKWKAAGKSIQRAPSFCYHLQRYSDVGEQEDAKRL